MTQADSSNQLTLDACLDVSGAEALLEAIREAFAASDALILDASGVERFTTPAAQIILSAFEQAEKQGKSCALVSPSEVVVKAFDDIGLTEKIKPRIQ